MLVDKVEIVHVPSPKADVDMGGAVDGASSPQSVRSTKGLAGAGRYASQTRALTKSDTLGRPNVRAELPPAVNAAREIN